MDLNREPKTIARAAAGEVRALNHRTMSLDAFLGEDGLLAAAPGNVSNTVDGLATMVERLPQTLQQLSRVLQQLEEKQAIHMDDGSDPSDSVSKALRALLNAQEGVKATEHALREAAGVMSHMGGHFTDDEETP